MGWNHQLENSSSVFLYPLNRMIENTNLSLPLRVQVCPKSILLDWEWSGFFGFFCFFCKTTSCTGVSWLYTTYILPIGWLYITYHLLREAVNSMDFIPVQPSNRRTVWQVLLLARLLRSAQWKRWEPGPVPYQDRNPSRCNGSIGLYPIGSIVDWYSIFTYMAGWFFGVNGGKYTSPMAYYTVWLIGILAMVYYSPHMTR